MAHYAFLNENNVVSEVITGIDETELIDGLIPEEWYGNFRGQKCVRTSYHGNIRKNYAGIGYTYDKERDAFIPPKSENYVDEEGQTITFVFNEDTCLWDAVTE